MAWAKLKTAVVMGTAAVLAIGITAVAVKQKPAQPVPPDAMLESLERYKQLGATPIIAKAVFETEVNTNMPGGRPKDSPSKTIHSLKKDGDNYVYTYASTVMNHSGRYDGTAWFNRQSHLRLFNPAWNPGEDKSGTQMAESNMRMNANGLAKWGILQLERESIIWEGESSLTSRFLDDQKKGWVDFVVENGVAISATVRAGKGGPAMHFISYKYDPGFHNGKLPMEYAIYFGERADEKRKMYTMRILELELSDKPLPVQELDPLQLFPSTLTWFYTNNIAYIKQANGKIIVMPNQ